MMRMGMTAVLALAVAAPAAAQGSGEFHWTGNVPAGQVMEIRGVNGSIHAMAASGSQVEVVATKKARRSDPASVHIQVVHGDDGVTICAVYPTPRGAREENSCAPGSEYHMNTRDNDVSVDFTVRVPAGVRFTGRTVNGNVEAQGMRADVKARTTNGSVHVATTGQADARTTNGSIELSMGRADWSGDLSLKTVNGSITLELPNDLNTELDARTVNGSIQSDFPLTVTGRISPRHLTATIGNGGRHLDLTTVNGDIRIRKAG